MAIEEFMRRHPDIDDKYEYVCDRCDGEGEEECFNCGSPMMCDKCDGSGFLGDVPVRVFKAFVKQEQEAWKRWCEGVAPSE